MSHLLHQGKWLTHKVVWQVVKTNLFSHQYPEHKQNLCPASKRLAACSAAPLKQPHAANHSSGAAGRLTSLFSVSPVYCLACSIGSEKQLGLQLSMCSSYSENWPG